MSRTRVVVGSSALVALLALACPSAILAGEQTPKKPAPTVKSREAAEACTLAQKEILDTARKAAAERAKTATDRARGSDPTTGEQDREAAEKLARKLIDEEVSFDKAVEITADIRDWLSSDSELEIVCESASDTHCAARSAYVQDTTQPIHLCPDFFTTSTAEQRIRGMIHESAHLYGIEEEGDSDTFCVQFDCETSCGGSDVADSWAHFVHCLAGETPDKPAPPEEE